MQNRPVGVKGLVESPVPVGEVPRDEVLHAAEGHCGHQLQPWVGGWVVTIQEDLKNCLKMFPKNRLKGFLKYTFVLTA